MGSRRRRHAALASALLGGAVALAACTSGAPPGFAGAPGDLWTLPLVGPLEGGQLLTPVSINAHGPYLFAIDPDAPITIIDYEVAKSAELRPFAGPHRLDETDTQRPSSYAELIGFEVGSLFVQRRDALLVPSHTLDAAGRRIYGAIGRDVIADSLAFGFDRERGVAYLSTQRAFRPPAGAVALPYSLLDSHVANAQVKPPPRRLVRATVGGAAVALHVDLGAGASQLREGLWARAGLEPRPMQIALVDEVGSRRVARQASAPVAVTAVGGGGAVLTGRATFVPYADKRWEVQDLGGTLGLGFFGDRTVWASWDAKAFYASPRVPQPAAVRISRWDSAVLARCPHTGCIEVRVVDPLGGKPPAEGKPHPGLVLSVTRDSIAGGMPLEVLLAAEGDAELPYLIVNLPGHLDRVIHQLKPDFVGKTLAVVDASPFPRKCPGDQACVDQLAR